ncbi:unnamed protein product [Cuscuta epithymum]|uniref:Transposase MuDR plant domain-containing protein n=1 Tax=Cuscuta epithymum TaxID=186058 RepID=A0AAV0D4K3_9ASTE|nr:unnamed protein product [Cuscuta epithymum]
MVNHLASSHMINPNDLGVDEDETGMQMVGKHKMVKCKGVVTTCEGNSAEEDATVTAYESDDSFEWDDDFVREELHYDDKELYEVRESNINKKKAQTNVIWTSKRRSNFPQDENLGGNGLNGEQPEQEESEHETVLAPESSEQLDSKKWPSYWTTYEGGYESEQRYSDDEDTLLSDGESDADEPMLKRIKGKNYEIFNEKADMKNVELTVGLRFACSDTFKQVVLAYSIQKHKDLVYMINAKHHIHIGYAMCIWELTSGPDLVDVSAWQIKSMQHIHKCTRTFNNRLITENWLAKEYLDYVLRNPLMTPRHIKDDTKKRFEIVVSSIKCHRGREKALNDVTMLMEKQYGLLKPYLLGW